MTREEAATDRGTPGASVPGDIRLERVRTALRAHGERLAAYPGVLSVRPGYRFRNGQLTAEPVISVSVLRKAGRESLDPHVLLPPTVDGVPVDVIPASPAEQVRVARQAGPELAAADSVGRAVTEISAQQGVCDTRTPLQDEGSEPALAPAPVPRREYPEPGRAPALVDEEMTLVCHAGPDAGWRLLRKFLGGTERRLAATMFEFTAEHVLDGLLAALDAPRTLHFVMDYERESQGLDNLQVQQKLASALGDRLSFAWAPVASDNVTTVGYFPSSYHIKVVVRDGTALWLSSGNFKHSSQPETDPFSPPPGFDGGRFLREHNREWHVIAESPGLAEQFEFFIEHDLAESRKVQVPGPPAPAPAPVEFAVPAASAEAPAPAPKPVFFQERVLRKKLRVMPLLTPRHFAEQVLPLVQGARKRVWFQNQSLKPSASLPGYMRLFNALGEQSRRPDLDVRMIVRGDFDPHRILMALQEAGYGMERVRLQNGCHTKGLIIDDDIVVVGSHNWTGQGTMENRDASLIVYDPEAVKYFAQLFQYDWENLATERVEADEVLAMPLAPGAAVPAGMRRVSWKDLAD